MRIGKIITSVDNLFRLKKLIKFQSFWKTIEHFLAKYECWIINLGKNLWLVCPPDKDVVEGHAA